MAVYRLENPIQPYAWGSTEAIAKLQGRPFPTSSPEAELWMGAHPKGPSKVLSTTGNLLLPDLIRQRPTEVLGRASIGRFGPVLPYLFKVLAAAQPLSIQVHPDKRQARAGFLREEKAQIAPDAPHRNYRDDNHKPEIICALTPFWGLTGFRPVRTAAALLSPVCPDVLEKDLRALKRNGSRGLKSFFSALMTLAEPERGIAARQMGQKAMRLAGTSMVYRWMATLAKAYPGDMGVVGPALLNLICLSPGKALYLPAGQLHAYLQGVGIELMANSDNVLRGGLTPKHVDADELLRVVRFEAYEGKSLRPRCVRPAEKVFDCPAEEFRLSVIQPNRAQAYDAPEDRGIELVLCTQGKGRIETGTPREALALRQGDSIMIPACLSAYRITGDATFYKASVPLSGNGATTVTSKPDNGSPF